MEEARLSGIPSDLKFQLKMIKISCVLQAEILCVYAQSEVEIYIIWTPLKHIPTPVTICWLWVQLHWGKLPQIRNYVCAPEAKILAVCAQRNIEIYIIQAPMKHIPTP